MDNIRPGKNKNLLGLIINHSLKADVLQWNTYKGGKKVKWQEWEDLE